MVATYIGVTVYIILFCGYLVYERFCEGKKRHFISKSEVDLATDAVWKPGDGDKIRAQDHKDSDKKKSSMISAWSRVLAPNLRKTA